MTTEEAKREFAGLVAQAEKSCGKPISKRIQNIVWEAYYAPQVDQDAIQGS